MSSGGVTVQRLADGVYGVVSAGGRVVEVRSLSSADVVPLEPADAPALVALALGRGAGDALGRRLATRKLAVTADGSIDAEFSEALSRAGAGYAWHLGDEDLTALRVVQRVRSRMKLVRDPWRSALAVPECVVARCRQAFSRGRILVVGDAAGSCAALAAMGGKLTVAEPDADLAACLVQQSARWKARPHVVHADVTEAVDPAWVGAFAAVLLEVPSAPGALRAGLDRAALFCRPGGTVSLLTPPAASRIVDGTAPRFGLERTAFMREHTAVLLPGLVESPLRLDHHLFRRGDGKPTPAEHPCPWTDAPPGHPERDDHAHFDIATQGVGWERVQARVLRALAAVDAVPVDTCMVVNGGFTHAYWAFAGGGHLAVVHNAVTGLLAVDIFPFHQALQDTISHMVLAVCPVQRRSGVTSQR